MSRYDVAIVGAGPIGLELAVGLKRSGINYVQFEAGQLGSTIQWYAPGTPFFSSAERIEIAGVPLVTHDQVKPTREDYLQYLRGVATQFDLGIRTYTRVTGIKRQADGLFSVSFRRSHHGVGGPAEADAGSDDSDAKAEGSVVAERVILAIGNLHRPRRINVPGEDLPHVSHYFGDPHDYFGKRIVIVGGKNSAVEAAIRLVRVGCDVTLSYRRSGFDPKSVKYWLLPELRFLIKKECIRFLPMTVPVEITADAVRIGAVGDDGGVVSDAAGDEVPADFVLVLTGYEQHKTLFDCLGVELEGDRQLPSYNVETMETTVPGVYVAGTAAAGTHVGGALEFIETSHVHVDRIVRAITGSGVSSNLREPDRNFLEN